MTTKNKQQKSVEKFGDRTSLQLLQDTLDDICYDPELRMRAKARCELALKQAKKEERERMAIAIQHSIQQQIGELSIPARKGGYRTSVSEPAIYFLEKTSQSLSTLLDSKD